MPTFPDSTIVSSAFNPNVVAALQDRTLQRVFRDVLYPRILFRMEAVAELWPVNLGANQTFTRTGLIRPTTRPLVPSVDPLPKTYQLEQWEATAQQWADTIDTHMPTSYVTLASQYLRNIHQLGLHSGQSLNRVVRDKTFNCYVSGNTNVVAAGYAGGATLPVKNLTGFTHKLISGRPAIISATNTLSINLTIAGVTTTHIVTAATPTVAGDFIHGGTLTIAPVCGVCTGNEPVLAINRSRVVYSGGGSSIEDISAADQFRLADIRGAVAQLRFDNVPPHEDGTYHCHLDPISESQIFGDNEFQRLTTSVPDYIHYRRFAVAMLLGVTFYRNTEAPTTATVDEDPLYGYTTGFLMTNSAGILIHRPIFTGQGTVEEKYLDESRYISEAGIQGKIGDFAVVNGGVQVMTERIRLVLRAPLDRLQQQTSSSWSYSGDWTLPTDVTSLSSNAAYKRAVIVAHGE
jgi:hypothetical protein